MVVADRISPHRIVERIRDSIERAVEQGVEPAAVELGDRQWGEFLEAWAMLETERLTEYPQQAPYRTDSVWGIAVRRVESPDHMGVLGPAPEIVGRRVSGRDLIGGR